ncbi:MAG: FtsW/RodA/SpoVE family cell cycle protein [Lachnospiraceae bacterium]|nr:FtsW/RodA/SpoVE family cell cycle protein [Lachnospiraceae bacterium]MBP3567858.1 FtsW/RodA/SpoVE family cell cycle protein [Lachnospiraceae bacterium]
MNQRRRETITEIEQNVRRVPGKVHRAYDFSLLFLTAFLVGLGLVMIYSTSSYNATKYYGDATFFLKKQAIFAVFGLVVMILVSLIDYRYIIHPLPVIKIRPVSVLYVLCFALQILVLVVGEDIKGAKRWIEIPGIGSFQPSELTKICVVLLTAYLASRAPKMLNKIRGFVGVLIRVAPLIFLVVIENLSTALVLSVIVFVICFVTSKKKAYYWGVVALGIAAVVVVFVFGEGFRISRIDAWLNVETHPLGYQTLQGLYAISSGGFLGKGLGNSVQKLGFIPESHNDMIFSVICEEMGLIGAVAILLLFLFLLWRLFVIAVNAPDLYGSLIAVGVMAHIAAQVVINVAVVTNTIPSTGIPLPFISYGGSSLVALLFEMGIALGVSNQIEYRE